jgi:hypothetical protein
VAFEKIERAAQKIDGQEDKENEDEDKASIMYGYTKSIYSFINTRILKRKKLKMMRKIMIKILFMMMRVMIIMKITLIMVKEMIMVRMMVSHTHLSDRREMLIIIYSSSRIR